MDGQIKLGVDREGQPEHQRPPPTLWLEHRGKGSRPTDRPTFLGVSRYVFASSTRSTPTVAGSELRLHFRVADASHSAASAATFVWEWHHAAD